MRFAWQEDGMLKVTFLASVWRWRLPHRAMSLIRASEFSGISERVNKHSSAAHSNFTAMRMT